MGGFDDEERERERRGTRGSSAGPVAEAPVLLGCKIEAEEYWSVNWPLETRSNKPKAKALACPSWLESRPSGLGEKRRV